MKLCVVICEVQLFLSNVSINVPFSVSRCGLLWSVFNLEDGGVPSSKCCYHLHSVTCKKTVIYNVWYYGTIFSPKYVFLRKSLETIDTFTFLKCNIHNYNGMCCRNCESLRVGNFNVEHFIDLSWFSVLRESVPSLEISDRQQTKFRPWWRAFLPSFSI